MDGVDAVSTSDAQTAMDPLEDPTFQEVFAEALIGAAVISISQQQIIQKLTGITEDIDNLADPLAE